MISIDVTHYRDLTRDELHDILALRVLVFVVGQKITSEPEIDGRDPECAHMMLWQHGADDTRRLIGTARIFVDEAPQVIGRVAIHPDFQGQGLGTRLMRAAQTSLGQHLGELHAQAHLEDWYHRLGWRRVGEPFVEAEIPHIMMRFDSTLAGD
ncbi:GNAT family N-acetyltransferase [Bradymonas sediminis]|uniref:GNAT family N-acetyltransferase n=1 Tax=Bradymonas sediminis TaxID=1548548 RepID=A0A2Z4FIT9_9DELT|nr:GNAT family N-acetyltransferase [Bradymonas sediminis]AWV88961.1 GNAT family N-acetyltransferase [Bradymonas sediminis]TDP71972.1 ElaA protein [Bradymonas sediminis]